MFSGCQPNPCDDPNDSDPSVKPPPDIRPADNSRLPHNYDDVDTADNPTPTTAASCRSSSPTDRSAATFDFIGDDVFGFVVLRLFVVDRGRYVTVGRLLVEKTGKKIVSQRHREEISAFDQ